MGEAVILRTSPTVTDAAVAFLAAVDLAEGSRPRCRSWEAGGTQGTAAPASPVGR